MATHVMIDLETLGTSPGSVIWSIGAVKFDPLATDLIDTFHVVVDVRDAVARGFNIDAGTMLWWMDPSRTAPRDALLAVDPIDAFSALHGFAQWFGTETMPVWGNGATFDNVLLRAAMEKVGVECPWRFWQDRCYRTVKSMPGIPDIERLGTHHDALSDAISQARHLQAICKAKGVMFDV